MRHIIRDELMTRTVIPYAPLSTDSEDNTHLPLYYTALIRKKVSVKNSLKTQYSLVSTQLLNQDINNYLAGTNIREKLDRELEDALEESSRDENTPLSLQVAKTDFPHKPTPRFKFAENLLEKTAENTDITSSTPHRLTQYFNP
ncbi:MAG TPA: hypothetical protein VD770_05600, partial [Coxiellaceae bacterium]|nr:hypothetical protein [Coxiellaceae bacterium]